MSGKLLIVYFNYRTYPLRASMEDLLYSFERYSGCLCYYVNLAFGFPNHLKNVDFDLIIFAEMLLSKRNLLKLFNQAMKNGQPLIKMHGKKIAFPQDEFYYTTILNQFINDFGIEHVFSVAPESEWPKIYSNVDHNKVRFDKVLTGYLEDSGIDFINNLTQEEKTRDIDIGYRSPPLRFSLGKVGYLKGKIAEVFKEAGSEHGLTIDISTELKDYFSGTDWYRFLLRCKYFIGIESGASLLDPDGKIYHEVNTYVAQNPGANFEEVEKHCFDGLDGRLRLFALGPKHLEACATKTCQVLIEGDYNGVLIPGKHYIPIKSDLSNVNEVVQIIKEDKMRETIVEQAYNDIVASKKYSFQEFVHFVFSRSLGEKPFLKISERDLLTHKRNQKYEKWIWFIIAIQSKVIKFIEDTFPKGMLSRIVKFVELK